MLEVTERSSCSPVENHFRPRGVGRLIWSLCLLVPLAPLPVMGQSAVGENGNGADHAGGVKESITIGSAGRLTWKDIEALDRERSAAPAAGQAVGGPRPHRVTPYPARPAPKDIGRGSSNAPGAVLETPGESTPPSPLLLSLETGFEAIPDVADDAGFVTIPPDTMGAAGPNHLMAMMNNRVRVQNKTGGVISDVGLGTFWSLLTGDPFDPKVIYDTIDDRWIATCVADANSNSSKVFFAISDDSDPTAGWTFYSFVARNSGQPKWADYPGIGVNSTWIAITSNMFSVSVAPTFLGAKMWVIDKAAALVPGGPITVTVFLTGFDTSGGVDGFVLQPCVTFGAEPTLYIMDNSGWISDGVFLIRLSEITGTGPAPTWNVIAGGPFPGTGLFFVTNNFSFSQIDAAQLGTATRVNTNDPRMLNAVFRNGRIWSTHSGGLPAGGADRTAVFWYQVDPTAMPAPIVQSGVLDGGADVHYFFPSIAANAEDAACIGFSRSDATRYVEAVYTGREGTDPPGTMGTIELLKAGEDSYVKDFDTGRVRWGDYSATVVDPADDLAFWTVQEYAALDVGPAANDDRWGTWWGKIIQDGCPSTPDSDGDGVGDACDICPGFDDALDTDGDGVPDGCDACPGFDDTIDSDGDGVADGCDLCPGFDDAVDSDGDGVPDGCDACPGFDDNADGDGDGIADGCDICPGFDDTIDADGDGVPDGCDACPGEDNNDPGAMSDLDNDGDVDGTDFLTFSNCFNGALNPPLPACLSTCADLDNDGDVDGGDFLTFSNCFNGALNPPACP